MDLSVPSVTLAALLLGTVRATTFILVAPPFNNSGIPAVVKGALAMCFSLVVLPHLTGQIPAVTTGFLVTTAITEAIIGAALGFLVQLLFTAVQMAGDLIDVSGGFSLQPAYDPMAQTSNASIGRLYNLLALTLLFTSGGELLLVKGFVTSYQGLPVGAMLDTAHLGHAVITALSKMFLAALQIGGPMIAVLLLADVALGLLSKASPALNVFSLGFPLKIMLVLMMVGLTFPLLPPAVDQLLDTALHAMTSLRSG
jgi:flagellar biosynthesis protein FliR